MNRQELRIELYKLAPTSYKGDFRTHLSAMLKKYEIIVNDFEGQNIYPNWDGICSMVNHLCESIKTSVKRVYQGQHSFAYSLLRTGLKKITKTYGLYAAFAKDESFFRMRVFDEISKQRPSREGLFHIPFDKRGIVKTERYSTPGYPCLYLGISSYVCWEEMNRPNLDKCYISRFHTTKEIKTFNMSLPDESLWNNDSFLLGLLIRFPLIIASMIEVKNKEDVFKPEYIIPQLLMEWIIEQINDSKEEDPPLGVYYTSVHVKDGFDYPDFLFNNLALPAQSPFDKKYSKELCEIFTLSNPTSDEIERAKGTYNRAENIFIKPQNADEKEEKLHNYRCSTFGQIERQLLHNTKEFPLMSIVPN